MITLLPKLYQFFISTNLKLTIHHEIDFLSLPLNCASHSLTDSICIELRSLRSSYSLSDEVTENVARPLDASLPPNAAYGPP